MNKGDDRSRYDSFHIQSILWTYIFPGYPVSRYRLNIAIHFRPIKHLRKWNTTIGIRPLLQVKFAIKNGFRVNNGGSTKRDIFSSWRDNGKSSVSATFSSQHCRPFFPDPIDFSTVPSFPTRYSLGQFSILLS